MTVAEPLPVDGFFDQAREFAFKLSQTIPLECAIIDDWNNRRIVFGASFTANCQSACDSCPLYSTVGEDPEEINPDQLQTTLVRAREDQIETFSAKQRFLNCKTLKQYCEAYIEWFVKRCLDPETVIAELNWVAGFRIVFLKGDDDLAQREQANKRFIVQEFLRRVGRENPRYQIALDYARSINLV